MNGRRFGGDPGADKEEETLGSYYMGRMQPPPENERVLPRGLIATTVALIFAGIIWYAYPSGDAGSAPSDVPLIKADAAQYKFTPADPGGMEVRHQDSTVFDPLAKKNTDDVEKFLPKPEEPLNKQDMIKAETKVPQAAPSADEALVPVPEEDGAEKVVSTAEEEANTKAVAADQPKPGSLTALATAKAPAPEATPGAIKDEVKEVTKTAAPPSATASGFYIQLGAFRDASKAQDEWQKLQKKFPQSLADTKSRVEKADLGVKGVWQRLYAGPLSEAEAKARCAKLKQDSASGCMVRKL